MWWNQTESSDSKGGRNTFWVKSFALLCAKISDVILPAFYLTAGEKDASTILINLDIPAVILRFFQPSVWKCLALPTRCSTSFISELVAIHCFALYEVCKGLYNKRHLGWIYFSLIPSTAAPCFAETRSEFDLKTPQWEQYYLYLFCKRINWNTGFKWFAWRHEASQCHCRDLNAWIQMPVSLP